MTMRALRPFPRALRTLSCAVVTALVTCAAAFAQNNVQDAQSLIEALQLKPGNVVAEVGAGAGDLTLAIARHVGSGGRVYTSELGPERVAKLRGVVEQSGLSQIQVVEGQEAHANLPEGCCDAIFMRNVYHHFGDPKTMNATFFRALKPGSRIAVIDFAPRNDVPTAPPGKRGEDSSHGVTAEVVGHELEAAGFTVVSSDERQERWFIVVAQKPAR